MTDDSMLVDGKMYMWDGEEYPVETNAKERVAEYEDKGFETQLCEDGGRYLVYTRRVVTGPPIEGAPP